VVESIVGLIRSRDDSRASQRENSVVESIVGLIRSRDDSQEGSLRRDLMKGCKAKFHVQPSVELPNAFVGCLTFQIQQHPETFLSYIVEQGFGKDLEVLEEHTQGRRVISTVSDDGKEEYVFDQVVKRVASNAVFIGVKSCRSMMKPLLSPDNPKYKVRGEVYLEGYFVESFHVVHEPRKISSRRSALTQALTSNKMKNGLTNGMTMKDGLHAIEEMFEGKDKTEYLGWPDRDIEQATKPNKGCKVTVLSSRNFARSASADEAQGEGTLLRQHLEGLILDTNSFYVRLNSAKVELKKVSESEERKSERSENKRGALRFKVSLNAVIENRTPSYFRTSRTHYLMAARTLLLAIHTNPFCDSLPHCRRESSH
jgi:hypothetical protein